MLFKKLPLHTLSPDFQKIAFLYSFQKLTFPYSFTRFLNAFLFILFQKLTFAYSFTRLLIQVSLLFSSSCWPRASIFSSNSSSPVTRKALVWPKSPTAGGSCGELLALRHLDRKVSQHKRPGEPTGFNETKHTVHLPLLHRAPLF